jgi:DNA-binding FadR family transcriptional regulator
VLGSEAELLARYGVSRAVFREAVRLVEHAQIARMRRGPGGGLVVTAPTMDSVIDAVAVYLFYAHARVDHVVEARLAVEETVAELATQRLTEDDIVRLRNQAEREQSRSTADPRELHVELAVMTKNPALAFSVSLLNRLAMLQTPDLSRIGRDEALASRRAHLGIIEAVVAGDEGVASHRMRTHLEAEAEYLNRRRSSRRRLDASLLRSLEHSDKLGERVARALFLEVTAAGWPVGDFLGSEAELMARFGVSRAVLREAVRLLEHHQIATMRRGPGGGLFVAQPGVDGTVRAVAVLMERGGISATNLFELRRALELTTVELAVKRLDEQGEESLFRALEVERAAGSLEEFVHVGHDLHDVLAGIPRNPVLELLTRVVTQLTRLHAGMPPGRTTPPSSSDVQRTHEAIVKAIVDRDTELAGHRMRRHLDALMAWVQ